MLGRNVILSVVLGACLAISGCGCLGYRIGSSLPPDIRSVFVPTFENATKEPQIEIRATALTIQEFRRDGGLRVSDEDAADARLEVTLTSYELVPIRYDKSRSKAGSEYRLIIGGNVVFRSLKTMKVLSRSPVSGDAAFLLAGDMATAKAQALPEAARDLAHKIVESVVEFWE